MLCLKHLGVAILAQGPVVKAAEYAALIDAETVIAQARQEAEQIAAAAQRDREEEKARGYREGLEQGKAEIAERVVATLGQSALYSEQLERALVDVVVKATRRVIGELEAGERVTRVVRQALELLRQEHQVRIKVPPAQREALQARLAELLAAFPRVRFLDVEADASLPDDGCLLETELGVIDAAVETQLRAIERALIQAIQ